MRISGAVQARPRPSCPLERSTSSPRADQHAGKGKDEVGILDIGINPAIRPPAGSRVRPWSQAGMITIGIGNNLWAGGDNTGDFGFVVQIPNATLTVDSTTVVDAGKLVLPSSRAANR